MCSESHSRSTSRWAQVMTEKIPLGKMTVFDASDTVLPHLSKCYDNGCLQTIWSSCTMQNTAIQQLNQRQRLSAQMSSHVFLAIRHPNTTCTAGLPEESVVFSSIGLAIQRLCVERRLYRQASHSMPNPTQ